MASSVNRYMIFNGEIYHEDFSDTPYIYCNILTLDRKAYFVEEHLALLAASAKELFDDEVTLSPQLLHTQIALLLESNHASRKNNVKVELRFDAAGDWSLYCHEATIYSGFVMRPLRPEPSLCVVDMPLPRHSTSASQSTLLFAKSMTQAKGKCMAVTTTHDGGIVTEPSAPLFLIKSGYLISPVGHNSVEKMIVERAARIVGLEVVAMHITTTHLADADEVIIADWQSITALSEFSGHIYLDIVATNIAKAAANLLR